MFFPEFLFQLSGRDQQVTWLDPVFDRGDVTTAAISVSPTGFTAPEGQVLILQNVHAEAQPGGGQACTELAIIARAGSMPNRRLTASTFAVAAGIKQHVNWSGSIIVPPRGLVLATGTFDAGVLGNNVLLDVIGILIPVGNIQRV